MRGQTAPRGTSDGVPRIELYVQGIKGMAAGTDGDADRVGVDGRLTVTGLVQLETDLRKVIKLGDGAAGDLGLNPAF